MGSEFIHSFEHVASTILGIEGMAANETQHAKVSN